MMENPPTLQEIFLEFRAGRMFLRGTRVEPDTRKGLVRIGRAEEGLVHLQWLDRNGLVEDDQIIFPDEACFEKVNQSADRVYILKFNSDSRKSFFWMQEPNPDRDEEICTAVNIFINQPLDESDGPYPFQVPESSEDTARGEMSSRAGNLGDQSVPSELASEATSAEALQPIVQLSDLQRILRNLQPAGTVEEQDGGLSLVDILKPELVLPLFEKLQLEEWLGQYLPEGSRSPEDIIELLQSPPFRQQVETFTQVLRSGQIDLTQFGVDPTKYKFTVLSFLEALEDSVAKTSESESEHIQAGQDEGKSDGRSGSGDAMDTDES